MSEERWGVEQVLYRFVEFKMSEIVFNVVSDGRSGRMKLKSEGNAFGWSFMFVNK